MRCPVREAEGARLSRLGDELAARQAAVLANGQQLSLLQEAEPARLVPATPILVVMGGLVGILLGLGLAQLLGVRRGTVQSVVSSPRSTRRRL